jgi:hypothetical protein
VIERCKEKLSACKMDAVLPRHCYQEISHMKIFAIGLTRKSAETLFARGKMAGVKRLIDVRLNNISQLAGFTKKDDLSFFT